MKHITIHDESVFATYWAAADRTESRITNGRLWHIAYRHRVAYWFCEGVCA